MNREEILAKSRQDKKYLDEREEKAFVKSATFGWIAVTIIIVVFIIMRIRQGKPIWDYLAIDVAYNMSSSAYMFYHTRKKLYLVSLIVHLIALVLFLQFFLGTV